MTVDDTLNTRQTRYGNYRDVANTAQDLKLVLRRSKNFFNMEPYMKESLDMICNKIGRIVSGDPYYDDSWHDIAGYATLVEKQLENL
jgi:small ligand-binding sensory domain FIST